MKEGLKIGEKKDCPKFQNGIGTRLGIEMYQNESNAARSKEIAKIAGIAKMNIETRESIRRRYAQMSANRK